MDIGKIERERRIELPKRREVQKPQTRPAIPRKAPATTPSKPVRTPEREPAKQVNAGHRR